MDNVTISEMMTFTKEISSRDVKIMEKDHIIEEKDHEIESLKKKLEEADYTINAQGQALEKAQMMLQKAEAINMFLKTYLVLKRERVKLFFSSIRDISITSLCYTFLVKSLPEDAPKEVLADINEMATLNGQNGTTNNFFAENSHCFVANGDMTDNEIAV